MNSVELRSPFMKSHLSSATPMTFELFDLSKKPIVGFCGLQGIHLLWSKSTTLPYVGMWSGTAATVFWNTEWPAFGVIRCRRWVWTVPGRAVKCWRLVMTVARLNCSHILQCLSRYCILLFFPISSFPSGFKNWNLFRYLLNIFSLWFI